MTAFDHLNEIAPNVVWAGVIARSLHGAEATLAALELAPDTTVPEHAHVNEQIGILTGGSLTFRIGAEEEDLRPGATWIIPANTPHSVRSGPQGAILIELFAPARTDWAGQERLAPSPPQGF